MRSNFLLMMKCLKSQYIVIKMDQLSQLIFHLVVHPLNVFSLVTNSFSAQQEFTDFLQLFIILQLLKKCTLTCNG